MRADSTETLAVLEIRKIQTDLCLGKYLIGSGKNCNVTIDDATVEKLHAVLIVQQHCVKIVDLLTESGTYVDDENICDGKFKDILKSVSIKFGSVDAQLRLIEESDSGFLGFISRDSLDIIPLSPQECTTVRHTSKITTQSTKSSFQSNFRASGTPSPLVEKSACDDMFLANVTDVNIRRNIEQMMEEDDYYVPETQEIFEKRPQSPNDNPNEELIRINTQEFKEDADANISANVMDNDLFIIPLVRNSPVLISELKNESPTTSKREQETRSEEHIAVVDVKTDDTESEISTIKWDESRNNSAAPDGDLDGLKSEEQINEESVTPDLELVHIRSGSTTPDFLETNETSTNIDIEEHLFSPTQVFQPKKLVATNSNTSSNQEQVPLNVSSNNLDEDPNLEVTQPFLVREQVNHRETAIPPELPQNDAIFVRPLPKPPMPMVADTEEYDNAELTQPFILKDRSKPSTSTNHDNDDDFDQFAATQRFVFDKRKQRSVSPAPIWSSDEEDREFGCMETQDIGEIEKILEISSTNKGTSKIGARQVAQEDNQPTPPNTSAMDKETETEESKKNAVNKKDIVIWLKKGCNTDEAIKQQNLLLSVPKDVQKKDSLSDQSTSSDARCQRKGRPKKRRKSNDNTGDKDEKQQKMSKNQSLGKNSKDVEEKKEVPPKETRSKRTTTSKKGPLKTTSEKATSRTTKNSKVYDTKSEYGDSPKECRRTSNRRKSVPSYMVDNFYTESDITKKIWEEENIKYPEEVPKTSRRKAVTKKLKEDPKKCSNLQKSSSDNSESETNNKSNVVVLRRSARKKFETSTPSVRQSARLQAKHRICFTRCDYNPFVDIMHEFGCMIENDPITSTVLVATKITRTWKMLAAIARGLPIVSPDWFKILESNYNESFSYDDYLLQDPSAEQQYKFNLKKSLQAARKKLIFENFTFFITPQTQPNPVEMTKIIESGGGSVINRYSRNIQDLCNFYIISTREDAALWKNFKSDTANVPIYSSEAVMSAVMQQCINFKHHQLS